MTECFLSLSGAVYHQSCSTLHRQLNINHQSAGRLHLPALQVSRDLRSLQLQSAEQSSILHNDLLELKYWHTGCASASCIW